MSIYTWRFLCDCIQALVLYTICRDVCSKHIVAERTATHCVVSGSIPDARTIFRLVTPNRCLVTPNKCEGHSAETHASVADWVHSQLQHCPTRSSLVPEEDKSDLRVKVRDTD